MSGHVSTCQLSALLSKKHNKVHRAQLSTWASTRGSGSERGADRLGEPPDPELGLILAYPAQLLELHMQLQATSGQGLSHCPGRAPGRPASSWVL